MSACRILNKKDGKPLNSEIFPIYTAYGFSAERAGSQRLGMHSVFKLL